VSLGGGLRTALSERSESNGTGEGHRRTPLRHSLRLVP